MKEYRYSLGKLTGICPNCGHKTFKYYIDKATGKALDEKCGRCNREHKCAYHARPSQFGDAIAKSPAHWEPAACREQPASTIAASVGVQNKLKIVGNNLHTFLSRTFGPVMLMDVFSRCRTTHALFCGNSTAFWLVDSRGRLRSAKVMAYDADTGRRIKDPGRVTISYAHTLLRLPDFNYRACFFCEHLAAAMPEATILIVESEKTALIVNAELTEAQCSDYVCVATGGASALSIDDSKMDDPDYRAYFLKGRNVILIPDADMVDTWRHYGAALGRYAASVRFIDPRREPWRLGGSMDIGDYILLKRQEDDFRRWHEP